MDSKKQHNEKRFFLSLFIIVLILFAAGSIYNNNKKEAIQIEPAPLETVESQKAASFTSKQQIPDPLGVVSGLIYRHLVAYNLVCKEAQKPLLKYPEFFSKKFASEIQTVNEAWIRRGTSLESVLTSYDSVIYPKTRADIQKELLGIERDFVKTLKAKDSKTTPDKIEWTAEQESKLNLSDACMLFDETAEGLVERAGFATMFRELMKNL